VWFVVGRCIYVFSFSAMTTKIMSTMSLLLPVTYVTLLTVVFVFDTPGSHPLFPQSGPAIDSRLELWDRRSKVANTFTHDSRHSFLWMLVVW
jgi:hypothetical protein